MDERRLNLFAGYQFRSSFIGRADLEGAILRATQLANQEGKANGYVIDFLPPDLEPGESILRRIQQRISEADICLFDISDGNRNVLFEIGFATGLRKPVILVKHSGSDIQIPTDLSGILYVRYDSGSDLAILLSNPIIQIAKRLTTSSSDFTELAAQMVWASGRSNSPVNVVGGEIHSAFPRSHVSGVHYVQSPDVQALVEAGGNLLALRPDRPIRVASCSGIGGSELEEHLVCVGGPRSNSVTREILTRLTLPWNYALGDPSLVGEARMKAKALLKGSERVQPSLEGESVRRDVFMIAFGPSPLNTSKRFLVLTGAFTFGVLGAARAISALRQSPANQTILVALLRRIPASAIVQIVGYVDVINGQALTPDLGKAQFETAE